MKTTHTWTKEDYILTFFVTKYGTTGLYLKTDDDISKFIGTSKSSLTKMKSNFNHLLGLPNQLTHIKNLQQEVFEEFRTLDLTTIKSKVKSIIKQDEIELKQIFSKLGRNPNSMKKIS